MEQTMSIVTTGEQSEIYGLSLKIGGLLMPVGSDFDAVTTKHEFFIPPTAVAELMLTCGQWIEHYCQTHLEHDTVYGENVRDLLDWEDWSNEE